MDTLTLLDRLIAFETVSRGPNRPLIDFVRTVLAEHGIAAELVEAEDGGKANLFCTIGPSDRPGIMLSGHTDVVPVTGQDWTSDPFRLRIADGRAYGRGAADMKGFVASALAMAMRAAGRDLAVPLHLAFSHDEEIGCVGVRSLIDRLAARGFRPRLTIVGEPTGMRIATGHKGKLAARATCRGVAGHSALAPQALNAIHLACDVVGALRARQDALAESGARDPDYAVPYTTIHVGQIAGGTALNIVPNRCTLDFEIRNVAADNPETILAEIVAAGEAIAAAQQADFPEARIAIERLNAYPGLATPVDSEAVAFLGSLVGSGETHKVAFGTEGGLFAGHLGTPTLVCGPGSMDQGHKPDEFVTLAQLAACDAMMDRLLDRLAA
ncbi:acetylornithine deacetylase [Methylobacterium sp. NEAU K]|uniref:acetylornithine deacetylase n=1 Tax=Methylobacterium sp. NEAU K TaxID=3064946 RepID=UPI00273660F5|nr:acetylornithine deacetylase [Methylobacterium sp. NEAU K]MDP4004794.1 acetylornithine deacetylase [Methylobacterium sp. NEAU K]